MNLLLYKKKPIFHLDIISLHAEPTAALFSNTLGIDYR